MPDILRSSQIQSPSLSWALELQTSLWCTHLPARRRMNARDELQHSQADSLHMALKRMTGRPAKWAGAKWGGAFSAQQSSGSCVLCGTPLGCILQGEIAWEAAAGLRACAITSAYFSPFCPLDTTAQQPPALSPHDHFLCFAFCAENSPYLPEVLFFAIKCVLATHWMVDCSDLVSDSAKWDVQSWMLVVHFFDVFSEEAWVWF